MKTYLKFRRYKLEEKDVDLESLYGYEAENKMKILEGLMSGLIGEILLNIDDQHMNEAEDWVKKGIEADKTNGMMFRLGTAYDLYAELSQRKGDLSGAKENLKTAIEIFKECGADGWLKKAEEALARI